MSQLDLTLMRDAVRDAVDAAIIEAEAAIRDAQLSGDVAALDALIHDDLLFTGPDGRLATKAEDLALHRSRAVQFLAHTPLSLRARPIGPDVVATSLRAHLVVLVHGSRVEGAFCYTRVWAREEAGPWRVVAGHVAGAPEDAA